MILNKEKNGHQVRKIDQTQKNQYSKVDVALFNSTKINKDFTKSQNIIRLDTDVSKIHLGLDKLKRLNLLSSRLILDFPCARSAHPMESMIGL